MFSSCSTKDGFTPNKAESLYEAVEITENESVAVFSFKRGDSLEDIKDYGFSDDDFDMSDYENSGTVYIKPSMKLEETGEEEWTIFLFFGKNGLSSVNLHLTFFQTPMEEAWDIAFQIRDFYVEKLSYIEHINEQGPSDEQLRSGSEEGYFVQWIGEQNRGEGTILYLSLRSRDTRDWQHLTQQDECVQLNLKFQL